MQTVAASQPTVTAVLTSLTGALSSPSTFTAAGLSGVTFVTASTAQPAVAFAATPALTSLPVTHAPVPASHSGARGAGPLMAALLLALAAAAL